MSQPAKGRSSRDPTPAEPNLSPGQEEEDAELRLWWLEVSEPTELLKILHLSKCRDWGSPSPGLPHPRPGNIDPHEC